MFMYVANVFQRHVKVNPVPNVFVCLVGKQSVRASQQPKPWQRDANIARIVQFGSLYYGLLTSKYIPDFLPKNDIVSAVTAVERCELK